MSEVQTPRSCGVDGDRCTVCCSVMPIGELDKPEGVLCDKCDLAAGCTIYATRPQVCRDYQSCGYLRGIMPERPDKAGIDLDFMDAPEGSVPPVARFYELAAGKLDGPEFFALVTKLAYQGVKMFILRHVSGRQGVILAPGESLTREGAEFLGKAGVAYMRRMHWPK